MTSNYKVLYRKYRPSSFNEIVGQKYSIEMLKNAVKNDKISHAYIFTGPRGTGKTSTAKIFAKTINCENAHDGIPCGTCKSCININNSADIIEIDAASNNGVDEIRELINNVKIAPSFSKYKVYIIDEVHMLSQSAFNALLLTLEEPPSHIVFILATTNIESVPITILSRCQRYDFKKLSDEELINHLKNIVDKENIHITEEAINEIAYLSEGGCRDALSILNQLSTSNDSIDLEVVLNNYGSVSMIQIKNIADNYIKDNYEQLKCIFDSLKKSSVDYKVFIKKIIDQLFIKAMECKVEKKEDKYIAIKDTIFELNDLINKININVDPFLLIFLALIKNVTVNNDANKEKFNLETQESTSDFEKELMEEENNEIVFLKDQKEINTEFSTSEESQEYKNYLEKLTGVRVNNCFAEADKNILLESKGKWLDFTNSLSSIDSLKSIVIDSQLVLASPKINIIIDAQESIVEMFNSNLINIEQKYEEYTGCKISFIALTNEFWEQKKKEYIKNKKENYVYQILDEPIYELKNTSNEINETLDCTNVLSIFDEGHVEVK